MKRLCGDGIRSALLLTSMFVLSGLALGCGTTPNGQFCSEESPCPTGFECLESGCQKIDSPDASASCPVETHECTPNIPADWTGPMLRASLADNGQAFSECASADSAYAGGANLVAEAECECECTTAQFVSCTDATMEAVGGSSIGCSGALCNGGCLTQVLERGVCSAIDTGIRGENNVRLKPGTITGGSCIAGTGSLSGSADFEDTLAVCPKEVSVGDCGETASCTTLAPEGYAAETCIFQEGRHDCPAGTGYTERTLTFTSFNDERSCGSCDCDLPQAGSSCGGETTACSKGGSGSQGAGCVASSNWNATSAYQWDPDPNDVSCEPGDTLPELSGEVTGVDPTTICCTPAK